MEANRLTPKDSKGMPMEWLQGLKDQDRANEIEYLRNCSTLFDKLRGMIQRRYDAALATKDTDYDSASWAYKQAHLNGKLEALEELYKLLP